MGYLADFGQLLSVIGNGADSGVSCIIYKTVH